MKPKPLHRSLSFWLGLPGLLFLLWSWHDSMTHDAGIFRRTWVITPPHAIALDDRVGHGRAGLMITVFEVEPGTGRTLIVDSPVLERRPILRELLPASPFVPFEVVSLRNYSPGNHVKSLLVPHWAILIAYGIAWGAVIFWRQARIRRACEMSPAAAS